MIAVSLKWSRRNLFGTLFDAALSITVIPSALWIAYQAIEWALTSARWDIIPQSLRVLMIGVYPVDQAWRVWAALFVAMTLLGFALGLVFRFRRHHTFSLILFLVVMRSAIGADDLITLVYITTAIVAFSTGWIISSCSPHLQTFLLPAAIIGLITVYAIMAPPGIDLWGGLTLSVLLTFVTAVLSLPIGILLALGRRSRLTSVRFVCTAYIEVMRSVPLILVIYWIWILMPVLAPQWRLADVARGMIGFTLFYSAYVAEYVRSGIQAIPRGQTEAARSLGMSEFEINRSIVLPQAVRVVVPALVGNVLDIFNSAPLVFIIGLTEFLRAGQMILANPQYGDRTYEVYSFLLIAYFLIGSLITYAARKLEFHMASTSP